MTSMRRGWPALVVSCATMLIFACSGPPVTADEFHAGMTRAELRGRFGEPDYVDSMTKHTEHIFGTIETYWSTLDSGTQIEIWRYPVEDGAVELYFPDGDSIVGGTAFAPAGAVY
jgi:hypothetical protein